MTNSLNIEMNSWVIQDWHYEDFAVGQKRSFALEFFPAEIQKATVQNKTMECIYESRYKVNAEIIFGNEKVWILDFGICAFKADPLPREFKVGDFVSAELFLSIDPHFYFKSLSKIKGIPAIIYDWEVKAIKIETAPLIEQENEVGRLFLTRDETKMELKEIEETDARQDDDGHGDYILVCEKINSEARHIL